MESYSAIVALAVFGIGLPADLWGDYVAAESVRERDESKSGATRVFQGADIAAGGLRR